MVLPASTTQKQGLNLVTNEQLYAEVEKLWQRIFRLEAEVDTLSREIKNNIANEGRTR